MQLKAIKEEILTGQVLERRTVVKAKKYSKKVIFTIIRTIFLLGFSFVILYPIINMIFKSVMARTDIFDNTVILIPNHFTLQNFQIAIILLDYWESLINTVLMSGVVMALQTISCLLAGYAFARHNFKLKGFFMAVVVFTIIVPPALVMNPMFVQFKLFDPLKIATLLTGAPISLIDTYWPFVLLSATAMGLKNGLFILIFTQFFRNMPKEFEEAACIDGASSFRTFFNVMLPNAKTAIATVCLFGFLWQYNDLTYTSVFLTSKKIFASTFFNLDRFTKEIYEILATSQYDITLEMYYPIVKSTGVLLILLPLILVFLFAQKYFVESIERVGIVG